MRMHSIQLSGRGREIDSSEEIFGATICINDKKIQLGPHILTSAGDFKTTNLELDFDVLVKSNK